LRLPQKLEHAWSKVKDSNVFKSRLVSKARVVRVCGFADSEIATGKLLIQFSKNRSAMNAFPHPFLAEKGPV
jgi:hypothetical protein